MLRNDRSTLLDKKDHSTERIERLNPFDLDTSQFISLLRSPSEKQFIVTIHKGRLNFFRTAPQPEQLRPRKPPLQNCSAARAPRIRLLQVTAMTAPPIDLISWINIYKEDNVSDKDLKDFLWEDFQADFEGWTELNFKMISTSSLEAFRGFLRDGGVWVSIGVDIARALFNTLQEENPTP